MRFRVIAGSLGGRWLEAHVPSVTRPTSERVREAVASALDARGAHDGARVLELCAGTGAYSFEALSRGAADAILVEQDRGLVRSLHRNAAELGVNERVVITNADALDTAAMMRVAAGRDPFDLVFVDPPYEEHERALAVVARLIAKGAIADGATVVLERATKDPPETPPELDVEKTFKFGETTVALARARPRANDGPSSP